MHCVAQYLHHDFLHNFAKKRSGHAALGLRYDVVLKKHAISSALRHQCFKPALTQHPGLTLKVSAWWMYLERHLEVALAKLTLARSWLADWGPM